MHRDRTEHKQEFIRTGSLGLDLALGGGWPVGHISELSGPPDSGKSVLAYYAIANAQAPPDAMAGFIDAHGTFNPDFARMVGVDLGRVVVGRSLDLLPQLLPFCALVVVDPLLTFSYTPSLQGTTVLYTTELRKNLGRYHATMHVRTGGVQEASAYVNLRASVREGVQTTTFKVEGASFTEPWQRMEGKFDILDTGIDDALEVLDWGVSLGVIKKRGNWYHLRWGLTPIQGRDNAAVWLDDHPKILSAIENQIRHSACLTG